MTPADHPAVPASKIGVLLINLGTPDAPEKRAVRRYLAEFLSDRRVIEIPPIAWNSTNKARDIRYASTPPPSRPEERQR